MASSLLTTLAALASIAPQTQSRPPTDLGTKGPPKKVREARKRQRGK